MLFKADTLRQSVFDQGIQSETNLTHTAKHLYYLLSRPGLIHYFHTEEYEMDMFLTTSDCSAYRAEGVSSPQRPAWGIRLLVVCIVFLSLTGEDSGCKGCEEDIILDPAARKGASSSSSGSEGSEGSASSFSFASSSFSSGFSSSFFSFSSQSFSSLSSAASSSFSSDDSDLFGSATDNSPYPSASGPLGNTSPSSDTEDISPGGDSDKDGLSNGEEANFGTDPHHPDSDNDGFSDGYEIASGFAPLDAASHPFSEFAIDDYPLERNVTALSDRDSDGLPDAFETEYGTSADLPDSDGDGIRDGLELLNGSDPMIENETRHVDTDADGLSDEAEQKLGTALNKADRDKDSLPDPFELLFSNDPNDPDSDQDGLLDGWETSPREYFYAPRTWHW